MIPLGRSIGTILIPAFLLYWPRRLGKEKAGGGGGHSATWGQMENKDTGVDVWKGSHSRPAFRTVSLDSFCVFGR